VRGYEVTLYHRGVHEVPLPGGEVEHRHGEPYFPDAIERDLVGRSFDLVVATQGRSRHLAYALRGRTPRLVTAGGLPVIKLDGGRRPAAHGALRDA
jgi:hypothetical protein